MRLRLDDLFASPQVAREIAQGYLDANAWVSDWTRSPATFFRAVEIEKRMMFLILLLISRRRRLQHRIHAGDGRAGQTRADIAILRTLGASPGSIMQIFMVQGMVIGLMGLALGIVGGVALALNVDVVVPALERLLGIRFLSADVYLISELPYEVHAGDVAIIALSSFVLTLVATIYPSWRASRIQPAEALRYE